MAVWLAWLTLSTAAIAVSGALPWPVRVIMGVVVALAVAGTLWRVMALRGPRALRAVEWTGEGRFTVRVGEWRRRLPAIPGARCLRYGARLWILRFETPEGVLAAVVDATRLEPAASRSFCRCLEARRRT